MTLARVCTECGRSLEGRPAQTKTCDDACRSRRSRRIRRANREMEEFQDANHAGAVEIANIVRREAPDIVTRVMKEQITPIVRESITEDTLRAINELVGLTPRAVAAISEDLDSEDAVIRQRAYTLLMKYTVGHPAVVPPVVEDANPTMEVHFNLPRPEALVAAAAPDDLETPPDMYVCDVCSTAKPPDEMARLDDEGTGRCRDCLAARKAEVMERLSGS